MHPVKLNKYLRRIITVIFGSVTAITLTLLVFIQTSAHAYNYGMLNLSLFLFCPIIAISSLIYRNTVSFLIIVLSSLMAILSLRTGDLSYLYHIIAYVTIGIFVYFDKEKERKINYSFKIRTDNIKDSYNTHVSEYEKRKFLLNSLDKKIKEFFRLKNIATTFSYSLTPKEITHKVTSILAKTIEKGDVYSFYLIHKSTRALKLNTRIARKEFQNILIDNQNDDFNRWILHQRQPLLISEAEKDYRFDMVKGNFNKNIKSLVASPLKTEDKILGILRIDSLSQHGLFKESFNMEDLRLLAVIANLAALAIKNADLFKETEELAIKDGLTSLYVVWHFKELLTNLINSNQNKNFALLMLDLDKFKNVNDNFGHLVGDTVLRKIASILKKECPKEAIISRYGGEEFAIALPSSNKNEALSIAESLRKAVEACKIGVRREKISITVSIGIAIYPNDGTENNTLIGNADKALYKSKEAGRNKVSLCQA